MTDFRDIDVTLADVFAVEHDAASYERALESTLARVELEFARPDAKPGRAWRELRVGRRRRLVPILAVLVIVLMVLAAVAVAQPRAFDWLFGDDPDAPANKVHVLRELTTSTPEEPRGARLDPAISMRSLLGPPSELDGDMEFFHETALVPPDPKIGNLLPLDTNLRLLLDTRLDGVALQVIAIPTTLGNVCFWWWIYTTPDRNFGGSCVTVLDEDHPVRVGTWKTSMNPRPIMAGIVMDRVRAVRIHRSDGPLEPAAMGRNAFGWRSPRADVRPTGVQVEFDDGSIMELNTLGARLDASGTR